jgi:PleD family two-component response regulator
MVQFSGLCCRVTMMGKRPEDGQRHSMQTLIADDEPSLRTALAAMLRAEGYEVDTVADGSEER